MVKATHILTASQKEYDRKGGKGGGTWNRWAKNNCHLHSLFVGKEKTKRKSLVTPTSRAEPRTRASCSKKIVKTFCFGKKSFEIKLFWKRPNEKQLFALLACVDWGSLIVLHELLQRWKFSLPDAVKARLAVNPEVFVPTRSLQRNWKVASLKWKKINFFQNGNNFGVNKARTGPRSAARFKPEVHPRCELTKCPEQEIITRSFVRWLQTKIISDIGPKIDRIFWCLPKKNRFEHFVVVEKGNKISNGLTFQFLADT